MRLTAAGLALASLLPFATAQETPPAPAALKGQELRAALKDGAADFWIYDDLPAAVTQAKASGRPLLVSFRCVP